MNVEGRPGGPGTSIRSGRAVVAPPVSEEVAEEVADVVVCAGVSCDESTSTSLGIGRHVRGERSATFGVDCTHQGVEHGGGFGHPKPSA